ncbi:hypothetical protein BST81_03005 [Leptolyngbya sp. 'hensonii']|nr:hypothetical protein BST81_03005 [Leptolyngbya sp. 'hensonii']
MFNHRFAFYRLESQENPPIYRAICCAIRYLEQNLRIVDLITPRFSALTPNPQPLPLSRRERGQGGEGKQKFIGVI